MSLGRIIPSVAPRISDVSAGVIGGRQARKVTVTGDNLGIAANSDFSFPIDETEEGELKFFIVAVNDENIQVNCILYDTAWNPDPISDRSMRDWALLGAGLTIGEVDATTPSGASFDKRGEVSHSIPFLARYKNTFSGVNPDYTQIVGTESDKWIVLRFEPVIRPNYSRIFFSLSNPTANNRLVLHYKIARIRYVELPTATASDNNNNEAIIDIS